MKFNFEPVEVVYDLDEEIKDKVYSLYDKYKKSRTEASLYELLNYIYSTKDAKYRREFFDLQIDEDRTVFDVYLDLGNDLDEEDAKFFAQYEDYTIKGLLKGRFSMGKDIPEDVLFKEINGKPLLEHLLNNSDFRPFILMNIKTRAEVIDILKRTNQTRLMQFLEEDLLFLPYDENRTVIEYLISNDLFQSINLDRIKHHPEIYDILVKCKKAGRAMFLSSEMLMQERNGRFLLDELLDNGFRPSIVEIISEDMIKLLLKYRLEYELSNLPYKFAFMEMENSDEKLFEYLTKQGILCYDVVANALKYEQHAKEVIDILEENDKLFMVQALSEEELLKTYGREETLLETLLRNNVVLTETNVTKKETFDLFVAYGHYEELCRSSEEMLLQTLPSGKKLYEELISQRRNIETEGINNLEIVDAILSQSDIRLVHCIGIEALMSNFELNDTYLDKILEFAKKYDKRILGYLRFEDTTVNEYAKIIIAHTRYGFFNQLRDLDKDRLLEDSQGTTLLEELLREDEQLTVNEILSRDLKSDIEIATILKLHGITQNELTYDEEYTPRYGQRYIDATIDNYKSMEILPAQSLLLQELRTVLNDGKTPIEVIDMIIASYTHLFAIGNPYASEVQTLIEMKKNFPDFHIELKLNEACYQEKSKTIYLEDLNPQVFHHEVAHAMFDMVYQKYIPDEFENLVNRLRVSTITKIKLENYDRAYNNTKSSVSYKIYQKLSKLDRLYNMEEIEEYLSTFTDGLEDKLIDRGYNPSLVKKVLSETYTTQEFIKQEKRIVHGELLDKILRIEHSEIQGLGDFFDGIYKGAYHDGQVTGFFSGSRLSGYGHGRRYYSQGLEYVFDEMLANYSSIVKMAGPELGMKKMEKYLGKDLAYMIATTYNQMALQSTMSQTINQTQRLG